MGQGGHIKVLLAVLVVLSLSQGVRAEEKYTVKPGDSLYHISKSMDVSIEALKRVNHLHSDRIKPRQVLLIPGPDAKPLDSFTSGKTDPTSTSQQETVNVEEGEELGDGFGEASPRLTGQPVKEENLCRTLGKWSNLEERSLFVRVVKTFLGVPYRLGGSTIKGMDCSAFVKKIYEIFSISLPRTAREQLDAGKSIRRDELEEGDLVFFNTRRTHVGIYIGNGEFVHASSQKKEVKVDHLDTPYFNKRFVMGVRIKEFDQDRQI